MGSGVYDGSFEQTNTKCIQTKAMAAWSSGNVSACGVMGREIESRQNNNTTRFQDEQGEG
jgi:hypothetical protein